MNLISLYLSTNTYVCASTCTYYKTIPV